MFLNILSFFVNFIFSFSFIETSKVKVVNEREIEMMNSVKGKALPLVLGATLGLGGSIAASKITGKPVGCKGSIAHVLTNDKIEDKLACFKEMNKEGAKDTLKLTAATGVAAGAGALATVASPKAKSFLQNAKTFVGDLLSEFSISGKSVKDIVKNTKVFGKFNSLPAPAKAAIAVGGAVLATGLTLVGCVSAAKAGYIEAQHESK